MQVDGQIRSRIANEAPVKPARKLLYRCIVREPFETGQTGSNPMPTNAPAPPDHAAEPSVQFRRPTFCGSDCRNPSREQSFYFMGSALYDPSGPWPITDETRRLSREHRTL